MGHLVTLETKRVILRATGNVWEIVPRSLGEPVGAIFFKKTSTKGFVSLELTIDEGWRHGFLSEALTSAFEYFFRETDTIYISIDGKNYHKELIECGMRPQIRGEIDKGYRIYKAEFENGACGEALLRAYP